MSTTTVTTARTGDAAPTKHATAILAIICISYFMVILDNSIIFTGLPSIESAMHFSPTGLTWVQDAYTLVFGVIEAASAGWSSLRVVSSLIVGAVLVVGLVCNEARAEQPVMPLRLFASRMRTGAYLTRMLYLAAMIGFFFFTTQYLQGVLGFSPLQAGLAFLPMSAVNFVAALLVTRLIRRLGATPVLVLGVVATLAGMAWLSRVSAGSDYLVAVALPMALIGIGQGLAFAPMTSAGLAGVQGEDAGAASGLINTFHQLGSSLGLGVLATVGAAAVPANPSATTALVDRVSAALTASTVMVALALLVVLRLVTRRRATQPTAAPPIVLPQSVSAAAVRP